jgi:ABC-type phosphonate transport system ATPase subunit
MRMVLRRWICLSFHTHLAFSVGWRPRRLRMACVIVTHNRDQAERVADRTMVMEADKLVEIGPTAEVLRAR